MATEFNGLLVTLDEGLASEHVELIIEAICLIKNVINVKPIVETDYTFVVAKEQIKREIGLKLLDVIGQDR